MSDDWLGSLRTDLPQRLTTARLGRTVRTYPSVDSSMTVAADWARADAPDGALVVAGTQTAGRGRLGRSWHDRPGSSLLVSLILRPPIAAWDVSLLPLAAGLAAAKAIERATGIATLLKWPNDVMIVDHKVAGVLVENLGNAAFVAGLGVNLRDDAVPQSLRESATSLEAEVHRSDTGAGGRPVHAVAILAAFLNALEELMETDGGARHLLAEWEDRMAGRDETVSVTRSHGDAPPLVGIARGLAPDGALRIETESGETTVYAGDVTLSRHAPAGLP